MICRNSDYHNNFFRTIFFFNDLSQNTVYANLCKFFCYKIWRNLWFGFSCSFGYVDYSSLWIKWSSSLLWRFCVKWVWKCNGFFRALVHCYLAVYRLSQIRAANIFDERSLLLCEIALKIITYGTQFGQSLIFKLFENQFQFPNLYSLDFYWIHSDFQKFFLTNFRANNLIDQNKNFGINVWIL